jgi:hypothetical protein
VTNPRIGFQGYTLASYFVGKNHFDLSKTDEFHAEDDIWISLRRGVL